MNQSRLGGMRGFTVVWAGQIVSLVGSAMTGFALPIWAYNLTKSATALALAQFFFLTPLIVLSPIAGVLVDRSNRKLMMMLSDLLAGASTLVILLIFLAGHLQIWHIYMAAVINGIGQSFQWPAYSAAISTMLPKEQYGRANGMMSLAESASGIFAPALAATVLAVLGLGGVLLIDVATFVFAIGALLLVRVPQPPATAEGLKGRGSIWREASYGLRYILERPSLLGLQLVFLVGNLLAGLAFAVVAPMILARTDSNESQFAAVQTATAIGGMLGGLAMSAWGGPRRRVKGVLLGWAVASLLGTIPLGLGRAVPAWIAGSFAGAFMVPIIDGSNQAIWQAKVAPDVQGRVFATRRLIAWLTSPLTPLIAGPLADYVLEPAMRSGGSLADSLGWLVGTGPGAGMALIFVSCGVLGVIVALGAYLVPAVRNAEDILPDHDAQPASVEPSIEMAVVEAT